jgi:class 3 adenylate cyclase
VRSSIARTERSILSTTQKILYACAAAIGVAGAVVLAVSLALSIEAAVTSERVLLLTLLSVSAIACGRFPIRVGLRDAFISLDSIPLVLAVLLLDPADAVILGVVTSGVLMAFQPSESGWAGRFWKVQIPLSVGLAMGIVGYLVDLLLFPGSQPMIVLAVPAFLVALALELIFDLFLLVEFEACEPGSRSHLVAVIVPQSANVFLPAVSAAILTPYAEQALWQFALLLPVLLVAMYGVLWVANSQQLEKRRGDRLKDTFSRYVPEGIVDDNLESMQQIELGGEQADLSVLFCDIRGFTSWSEDKGATEVVAELNVLLTELSAAVMGTGGTLDKFTGDGLMAFWGAPVAMEDHADRASRAALEMLRRLDAVNDRRREQGHEPFAIGVAVHSGPAVVGNVGHERRLDYTAIGDTVNTTARLEASTKELGAVLLVSRATVDLLGDELRSRAMRIGDVAMKGKARPVEAWALQPLRPELDEVDDEFAA